MLPLCRKCPQHTPQQHIITMFRSPEILVGEPGVGEVDIGKIEATILGQKVLEVGPHCHIHWLLLFHQDLD